MSNRIALARRSFLGSVAAIGGGFALGWHAPIGKAFAQAGAPEPTCTERSRTPVF